MDRYGTNQYSGQDFQGYGQDLPAPQDYRRPQVTVDLPVTNQTRRQAFDAMATSAPDSFLDRLAGRFSRDSRSNTVTQPPGPQGYLPQGRTSTPLPSVRHVDAPCYFRPPYSDEERLQRQTLFRCCKCGAKEGNNGFRTYRCMSCDHKRCAVCRPQQSAMGTSFSDMGLSPEERMAYGKSHGEPTVEEQIRNPRTPDVYRREERGFSR